MGFDLFGVEPANKKGEYFRNNIWWWPRLWDLCCEITPEISDKERNSGHHNEGILIDGTKHKLLIKNLKKVLEQKDNFNDWIKNSEEEYIERDHWIEVLLKLDENKKDESNKKCNFPFDWKNVEEFLEFIMNNKGFRIC